MKIDYTEFWIIMTQLTFWGLICPGAIIYAIAWIILK